MSSYGARYIWGRSAEMERELARSRAWALLREIEEMEFCHRPRAVIWKAAVHAHALAVLAQDRVAASNAAAIVARMKPPKTAAEQIAIHRKAIALLARSRRMR